jgi:UDP-N-acetyl-D-glucosamine dehydrogenase
MMVAATDPMAELKSKMETRKARIGIIGMGYVGLPLALLFSIDSLKVVRC